MELRIIASNEKIFTETEFRQLEEFHLKRLDENRHKITRLSNEFKNAKQLISRLTERIMVNDLDHLLKEWMESEFDGTEADDRKQLSKKIVSYLSNVQQI